MALGSGNRVYVADSLNHRVQVLDKSGQPIGMIGKPGDRVGSFGRPKDVAVGPDGTIFVVDSASQRVHVFNRAGKPITAFGEPRGGMNELCIPSDIEISTTYTGDMSKLPDGFLPDYFVLVAEQLRAPGIRVFAWRSPREVERPTFPPRAGTGESSRVASVPNPHWSPNHCTACHDMAADETASVDRNEVDQKCLSCHDGEKAHAEAHPIGRLGHTAFAAVPTGWPLNRERLSCITCHDIRRHCDAEAVKPARNSAMLRGPEIERRLDFCTNCHTPSEKWRINPHRQLSDDGTMRSDTCGFCHSRAMEREPNGERRNDPSLRASGSGVCLGCHAPHWDYFPEGHVDRPVTKEIRRRLIAREFGFMLAEGQLSDISAFEAAVSDANHKPAFPPLNDNNVTCYSCHNPHERGLFPADSHLGRYARAEEDSKLQLRMDRLDLCQACHSK
ncbi:MAG: hypothetical protein IPK83_22650 [Planctomycetes bacterium]|nr:hypothetical protein [Planctomycetota bacterium]